MLQKSFLHINAPKCEKGTGLTEENGNAVSPIAAILIIVATFFFTLFAGGIVLSMFGYGASIIGGEILLTLLPLAYMVQRRVNIPKYVKIDASSKSIILGIALGACALFANVVVTTSLVLILGESEAIQQTNKLIVDMSSSMEGLAAVIISLCLAGICEEFVFRGFLQNAINSRYSFKTALIVSSLAFAFFHFDPEAVYTISAFAMGLLLGYIYHHWRSYTVAAVTHASLNLIALALTLLIP